MTKQDETIRFTEQMRLNIDQAILKHEADIAGLSKRIDAMAKNYGERLKDLEENRSFWRFW